MRATPRGWWWWWPLTIARIVIHKHWLGFRGRIVTERRLQITQSSSLAFLWQLPCRPAMRAWRLIDEFGLFSLPFITFSPSLLLWCPLDCQDSLSIWWLRHPQKPTKNFLSVWWIFQSVQPTRQPAYFGGSGCSSDNSGGSVAINFAYWWCTIKSGREFVYLSFA